MSHSTGTGHAMAALPHQAMPAGTATGLRVTLSRPEAVRLHQLCKVTGAGAHAAVLGDALRIYEALVEAKRDGAQAIVRFPDGHEVDLFVARLHQSLDIETVTPPPPGDDR